MTFLNEEHMPVLGRREVLKTGFFTGLGAVALAGLSGSASAAVHAMDAGMKRVSFHNVHTGEKFVGEYKAGARYLPDAFDEINAVLRDFRTGEVFPIDPRVLDILYEIQQRAGYENKSFEILSGYRSPKTNNMLRRNGSGVAKNSFHMTGQAVDVRIPGVSTNHLRKIARTLRAGGVGYYAKSDFLHIDTGNVRTW